MNKNKLILKIGDRINYINYCSNIYYGEIKYIVEYNNQIYYTVLNLSTEKLESVYAENIIGKEK